MKWIVWLIGLNLICWGGEVTWPTSGWEKKTPEVLGLNGKLLDSLNNELEGSFKHIRAFLIAYKGYLVFERYNGGYGENDFQEVCSVTKSVTSALVGIAMKEGLLESVDTEIMGYFPSIDANQVDSNFKKVTIHHLLTMSPGFNINDTPLFDKWQTSADPTKFTFALKIDTPPGTVLEYNGPGVHLLSAMIRNAYGKRLEKFAAEYLYKRLGMREPDWRRDPRGNNWGNFRSSYRPRDLLKFGYLYLQQGVWEGEQIIPKDYVLKSTTKRISGELFGFPTDYGYLWYLGEIEGMKTFSASGYGGQYIYVIPQMEMVVVCVSALDRHHGENYRLVPDYVIPLKRKDNVP